jgi:hypothetical protein
VEEINAAERVAMEEVATNNVGFGRQHPPLSVTSSLKFP